MARPVERWLGTFMCTQYTDTFEAYGYKTLQSVCQLDVQHLRAMGVLPEHCEKIMENVSVLRQSYMGKMGGSAYGDNPTQGFMQEGQMPGGMNYQPQGNSALQMDHMPGMPPAYQGQGYCKSPGQGHGGDQRQLYQQQMYSMRAAGYMPQLGGLPRQPYPAGGQYGLSEAPPRYPSASAMCRPSVAAAAVAAAAGGSDSSYGVSGLPAPVHHHLRNARSSQNPQLVADNILHMASATYPCNGPQVIPPGINKFHTPRMASPKQMMTPEVQMAVRQSMGITSGQFEMNHMSPTSGKGNPATQMWPNADGCCSGPMPCIPHQMSPHMVAQQDSCYGNQFHYSAKSGMMSPDAGHMMSPDPSHMMSPDAGHMMSPDAGHMMSPDPSHMMSIRSPAASIQSGPSVASTSPGPMCSPAAGSLCSPHTDKSPASITSPALRSPAGQSCIQSTMMHGLQHGSQLPMGQQPQHYMPTDQYAMFPPYSQPYQPCSQPVSSGQSFGVHQSNPLQSLQKLVMLPESQVVNPKSVVSEACLSDRGDGAGTAPPPGKRKRCTDGVHCGSEDETDPLGPRTDQVDHMIGQRESLPDVSYFHDAVPYSMVDVGRRQGGESPMKPPSARKKRQNKKAKSALGQDGVDTVSLAPNLNCTPVAGTGQPESVFSLVLAPRSDSETQPDTQTHIQSVTQLQSDAQTHIQNVTQNHIESDTQTHIESVMQCHSVADTTHCGKLPDGNGTRITLANDLTSTRSDEANCLITSTGSSASSNCVKGDGKTKKSRSKKHAKSKQQCLTNVDCSRPCVSSPAKSASVKEGTGISPGELPMVRGMKSVNKEQHEANSACTTGEKQDCDNLRLDSELGDTTRKSQAESCGSIPFGTGEQINNGATISYNSSVEETRVTIKQTTMCSSTKDSKVKAKTASTYTPMEGGKLNKTGVSVEEGNMRTKGRLNDRKLKVVAVTDCAVGSDDTTKYTAMSLMSTGQEPTRTQLSVSTSKPLFESPSCVSTVRMSSPKPMRPQQVDLTKIGKDTSGRLPKTSSRRSPKVTRVEDTTKCDNLVSCNNGDLSRSNALTKPKSRTVQQKFEHNSPHCEESKFECSTRGEIDQKAETLCVMGTPQPATPHKHDSGGPLHTDEKHLLGSDKFIKNNGLFTDTSNCKTSVQRTKRKRRKNTEKQTAGVKTNHQGTTTRHKPESPGCVAPTNQTKDVTTNTAEETAVSDEDDVILVKRESAKKVYGRSPDKKNLVSSGIRVSTSPDEKMLPYDEKELSSDEKVLPSNEKLLPSDEKLLPSDEKLLPSDEKLLPSDDKLLPSDKKVLPTHDKVLISDEKLLPSDKKMLQPDEKLLPSDEISSSNDCVAEANYEETKKTSSDVTPSVDESLQTSGRGKRKRVPNRYFNFGGEVVWWEVPSAFKRKRLHKPIADNNSGKNMNHKKPCVTKTAENSVEKLRRQKAEIVNQLLQTQSVGKRTKNGALKALTARTVDNLCLDDELPLSVLCKKKPVATVLPLTSVHTDPSPRKCLRQKHLRQPDEKVTRHDPPTRQRLNAKQISQDEPPTCIDIVTLVSEEPLEQDSGQTDMSEKELEVEEVEEEEYVLCPDTCQTLDLFVPDALDAASDDKRSEMEIIDCDSDSERPDMDTLLDDTAAFSDDSASPSHLHTLLTGKSTDAIYIISSSEDEREPTDTETATDEHKSSQETHVVHRKEDKVISRDDPTSGDTGQTPKGRPTNTVTSRCKDQRPRGAKPRGQRKKSKQRTCFDYDDDSADERLKNHLTKAFSGSQKGSKAMNKDRGSSGGHVGPYVRLKGCKETPILCEVVSLVNDDMEKMSKPHPGRSNQGHKHSAPAAKLSFKLIDSEPFTCVFCGKGSCYHNLSDLFGPYHPEGTTDDSTARRRGSRESVLRVGSIGEDALPQEMWLHEDCAVWASGVYLIGSKLHGLDEAVTAAQQTMCSACKCPGATLGCYSKGCSLKYHYLCALDKECHLDEENFSMLCPRHKDRKVKMVGQSTTVT